MHKSLMELKAARKGRRHPEQVVFRAELSDGQAVGKVTAGPRVY